MDGMTERIGGWNLKMLSRSKKGFGLSKKAALSFQTPHRRIRQLEKVLELLEKELVFMLYLELLEKKGVDVVLEVIGAGVGVDVVLEDVGEGVGVDVVFEVVGEGVGVGLK